MVNAPLVHREVPRFRSSTLPAYLDFRWSCRGRSNLRFYSERVLHAAASPGNSFDPDFTPVINRAPTNLLLLLIPELCVTADIF